MNEIDETWLAIPGIANYLVSSLGRIYAIPRLVIQRHRVWPKQGRILKQFLNSKGYLAIRILGRSYTVHRLVVLAFIGPRPEGMEIDHLDGNKTNNNKDNLEYVSAKENTRRAIALGNFGAKGSPPGERHPQARLSDKQVSDLRHLRLEGMAVKDIAAHFGLSRSHVYSILKGKKRKVH